MNFFNSLVFTQRLSSNLLVFFIVFSFFGLASCRKNELLSSSQYALQFSVEKIEFDTIFTKTGSITRTVQIYNPNKGTIVIDAIELARGHDSQYIMNVNGVSGTFVKNIELAAQDSMYIFLQALLDENNVDTLVQHVDSIRISYNSKQESIPIISWGQDVIKHRGEVRESFTITAGKPHVILDSLVILEGHTLTVEAGARLYFHYNANLIIEGSLVVQGTGESPVSFSSNRIEQAYETLPGQWGSIIFRESSTANILEYAVIRNGVNGLRIYGNESNPISVSLNNTRIQNMSANVIFAENAHITASNCVFANANDYILALQGGTYSFTHTTISNQGAVGGRNYVPSVAISNYSFVSEQPIPLSSVRFSNSIIVGKIQDEIAVYTQNELDVLDVLFHTCLVKTTIESTNNQYFTEPIQFDDTENLFRNMYDFDFTLDTLSQAIDKANFDFAQLVPTDFRGESRLADTKPDIGAYEFFTKE